MGRDDKLKNSKYINELPNNVKKDMSMLLKKINGKSKEEKIKEILKFKKDFDKNNIDENLKENIANEVKSSLSNKEKEILNKK